MRQATLECIERMESVEIDTDRMIEWADDMAYRFGRLAEMASLGMKGDHTDDTRMIRVAEYRHDQRHMKAIVDRLRLVKAMSEFLSP